MSKVIFVGQKFQKFEAFLHSFFFMSCVYFYLHLHSKCDFQDVQTFTTFRSTAICNDVTISAISHNFFQIKTYTKKCQMM